jgi:hypothetical protein
MKIPKGDFRTYPEWVHQELMNWARWCWKGAYPHPLPPTVCASIEKNYQRISDEGTVDDVKPVPPNEAHAKRVQAVWDALPRIGQQVLRAEYPQRFESGRAVDGRYAAARWLHMSLSEYESCLSMACYRVMVEFERGA